MLCKPRPKALTAEFQGPDVGLLQACDRGEIMNMKTMMIMIPMILTLVVTVITTIAIMRTIVMTVK